MKTKISIEGLGAALLQACADGEKAIGIAAVAFATALYATTKGTPSERKAAAVKKGNETLGTSQGMASRAMSEAVAILAIGAAVPADARARTKAAQKARDTLDPKGKARREARAVAKKAETTPTTPTPITVQPGSLPPLSPMHVAQYVALAFATVKDEAADSPGARVRGETRDAIIRALRAEGFRIAPLEAAPEAPAAIKGKNKGAQIEARA